MIGLSKLLNRSESGAQAGNGGGRVPVNPNTENKIPVVYGTAFMAGSVIDAKISEDQKTMWYVFAMSEVTDSGTLSYDEVYWNSNKVTFDGTDHAKVTKWTTNSDPAQEDAVVNDHGWIYLFTDGSSSGVNTGGKTAIEILSVAEIPLDMRWVSTCTMDKTAFMIVKIIFKSPGITSMPTITSKMTNTLTKPGDVIYDYMTNERYGCGIKPASVDAVISGGAIVGGSLHDLNTYSDQSITFYEYPYTGVTDVQPRYRVNGPIMTGNECMTNLTQLTDACDSWLKFNEIESKWSVVINKAYDQSPNASTTLALYHVTDDNLIGGIEINPTDLNSTYNAVEIQYPDTNIKDATGYQYIKLIDTDPAIMSPNEPFNQQTISLQVVNNAVQAYYIGARRLYQGREDLSIYFMLDYSGIQIEAGDVIRVTSAVYGWDGIAFPDGKLFRVIQVQEAKGPEGSLGARIVASEYNETVYLDSIVYDYIPSENSGLADPAIIDTPAAPTVVTNSVVDGNVASFKVSAVVPTLGQVLYMDYFYGTTSTVADHKLYRTLSLASGDPSTGGSSSYINVTSFNPGDWYWSVRARNNIAAKSSVASSPYTWSGPGVTSTTSGSSAGWSSSGALFTGPDTTGILPGYHIRVLSGVGVVSATAVVTTVPNSTQFNMSVAPSVALVDDTIQWSAGGIDSKAIVPGAVDSTKITPYNPVTKTGGLTINTMGAGLSVSSFIGEVAFSVAGFGVLVDPVSILSTSTRNIPVYIPGTTVSSTKYFPWFQGTASTADGFWANSTSPFNPLNSVYLSLHDGDYNWYEVNRLTFSAGVLTNYDKVLTSYILCVVSDVDTTIQVNIGSYDAGFGLEALQLTEDTLTINLKANEPQRIEATAAYTSGMSTFTGGSLMIRNMVSGTNVYCTLGLLRMSKAHL
jgi:hypothetical protein